VDIPQAKSTCLRFFALSIIFLDGTILIFPGGGVRQKQPKQFETDSNRMSASIFELTHGLTADLLPTGLLPLSKLAISGSHPGLADSSPAQPWSGAGEGWVDAFMQQHVLEPSASSVCHLPLADTAYAGSVSSRLALVKPLEPVELEGSAVLEQTDPLTGAGIVAAKATASPVYPGYLLQYVPGRALESRPAVAQWQRQMQQRGWTIAVDGLYGPQSDRVRRSHYSGKMWRPLKKPLAKRSESRLQTISLRRLCLLPTTWGAVPLLALRCYAD
jgi:hypothetical protein